MNSIVHTKINPVPFEINGATYPLVFDMNVVAEIEEQYGSLDAWSEAIQSKAVGTIRDTLSILVCNAAEDSKGKLKPYSPRELGKMLSLGDMSALGELIMEVFSAAMPNAEGDGSKNAVAE